MTPNYWTRESLLNLDTKDRGFPEFSSGDTISVSLRIREGDKERLQAFEGVVIAIRGAGNSKMFTVRKIAAGNVAVERILPFQSPLIENIKVLKKGVVRRAKLYYLRGKIGKAARVKEKIISKADALRAAKAKAAKAKAAEVGEKPTEVVEPAALTAPVLEKTTKKTSAKK